MCNLLGIAADCYSLEEFDCSEVSMARGTSTLVFKAICQLLSKFPSLKQVAHAYVPMYRGPHQEWSKQARPLNKYPCSDVATLKKKLNLLR